MGNQGQAVEPIALDIKVEAITHEALAGKGIFMLLWCNLVLLVSVSHIP